MAFNPDKYLAKKDSAPTGSFDPDSYLAQNTMRVSPNMPEGESWLDKKLPLDTTPRGLIQGGLDALPAAGAIAGGIVGSAAAPVAGTIGGAALGSGAGYAAKNLGEEFILGKPKTRQEIWGDPAMGIVEGATAEMGGQVAGKVLGAGAGKLKKLGEKSAVNATGATGKQASEFSDDAGRQLLDRKVVRFGDSQEKISKRAAEAVKKSEGQIDSALKKLEAKGVTVDRNKVYNRVRERISELKGDESQADIVKLLENELDNVVAAADVSGSKIPLSKGEQIKRGYNRKAGNWADPEKGQVGKEMYQTFRSEVEGAAEAADPEIAKLFREGKKSYGLMSPIQEAAERRAATTQQSPAGGLMDVSTAIAGFAAGGGAGAIAAPVARRVVAPRIASTIAVGADKMGNAAGMLGNRKEVLSGLIRMGLLPKSATDKDLEQGLQKYQEITEGYEQ